ncbi:MAG: hypothetical protein ACE5KX_04095 [Acidimicrobiia bacterium]
MASQQRSESEPARLQRELVAAYPEFVLRRLAELELDPPPGMDQALREGEQWLEEALGTLLSADYRQQSRSPLELFQEAMRFPTEALQVAGVPEVPRDPAARSALPGDRYDLAPASSAAIGDEVWQAHVAWGLAKARGLTAPGPVRVGLLGANLMDRSRIEEVAAEAGFELEAWVDLGDLHRALAETRPLAAFVDLEHPESDEAIRALIESDIRTVVFGPHVDDFALMRARSLGADDALARSRFFRKLRDLLPTIA